MVTAREIESIGVDGIVKRIQDRIGNKRVYVSINIDVLNPVYAPGTGTVEAGGFTSRELLATLDGLEGLNIIGTDIVEVSPPYDINSGITGLAGATVAMKMIDLMVLGGPIGLSEDQTLKYTNFTQHMNSNKPYQCEAN